MGYLGIDALFDGLAKISVQKLNLSDIGLDPVGLTKFATLFTSETSFTTALTAVNVMKNPIGEDGLETLMSAIKGTSVKTISSMTEGQTSLDWSNQGLKPFDLKILATDISFSEFSTAIKEVNLSMNKCFGSKETHPGF